MRTVEIEGFEFEVRPLLRGEIKNLRREKGINIGNIAREDALEVMDVILEIVLPDRQDDIDRLTMTSQSQLFTQVMNETGGAKDEEKNSSSSGAGS